ncbi:MAG: AbrB/MazE/SpoVT family DNA-binding domain-containing protein [Clostridiales bacterium]|nr:AbrB/MazE/SpoVT family DNA-binding domain-containing protein [Clostridiales bacterium]
MKDTGIVRNVDGLGRIVIPKELRDMLHMETGDSLEVYVMEDGIVLKKYHRGCELCGSIDDTIIFKEKEICPKCLKIIKEYK